MCPEWTRETSLCTPKITLYPHFILWWACRTCVWTICVRASPNNEFKTLPFLKHAQISFWWMSGECFRFRENHEECESIQNAHQRHNCAHPTQRHAHISLSGEHAGIAFEQICLTAPPDNEFDTVPCLTHAQISFCCMSGVCFLFMRVCSQISKLWNSLWNPHHNHISTLHTR